MRRYIASLIQIVIEIPEIEFDLNIIPGKSLYLFPEMKKYKFDFSGRGHELDTIEEYGRVEIPLLCNGFPLNKDVVLMVLNAAFSEMSMPTQSKLALRGVYQSGKFS